jgi:hypothetical protein
MPGTRNRSSSSSGGEGGDANLKAVLEEARKAVRRGDGWVIEPSHYARLRKDFEAIGFECSDAAVTTALRKAFAEIQTVHRRPDASYSGLAYGQTLYEQRWDSQHFGREMYIKFAMGEGVLELFTFHEHVDQRKRR